MPIKTPVAIRSLDDGGFELVDANNAYIVFSSCAETMAELRDALNKGERHRRFLQLIQALARVNKGHEDVCTLADEALETAP
jgi:hypothetical protein